MKKIIFAAFTFFFFCSPVFGQDQYITLTGGLSLPVGDYASTSVTSESAGMAKTGFCGELAYYHRFSGKKGGLLFSVRSNSNPLNVDKIEDEFEELFADFGVDSEWSFKKASYKTTAFSVGGFIEHNISETSALRFRGFIGYSFTAPPNTKGTFYVDGGGSGDIIIDADNASSLYLGFGVGGRAKINDQFLFIYEMDYAHSNPEFKTTLTAISDTGEESSETAKGDQPISTFGLSVGIAYIIK